MKFKPWKIEMIRIFGFIIQAYQYSLQLTVLYFARIFNPIDSCIAKQLYDVALTNGYNR